MKAFFILLLCLLLPLSGCEKPAVSASASLIEEAKLPDNVRAMWITQFDMTLMCLDGDGQVRVQEAYEARVNLMVSKLRMIGVNTVFIQARPNADALYPSSLFPASEYAVGKSGGEFRYDPFGILVDACKKGGISPHAWINPLRAMKTDSALAQNTAYPVGAWIASANTYGRYVVEVDGYYYLNPAYDEVRALIADGAREILRTYPVDGLHIDDYFYPTTDASFDAGAFYEYQEKGGTQALDDFRRAQTEALVRTLSKLTRAEGRLFGVSPGGNTTRNYEELYADVLSWCEQGLPDYLCPQIYFGLEHQSHPFLEVCQGFDAWAQTYEIPLIVGMTLEKAANACVGGEDRYAGTGNREWIENDDVLARCLTLTKTLPSCRGVALFSYRLWFSPENGEEFTQTAKECEALLPGLKEIAW